MAERGVRWWETDAARAVVDLVPCPYCGAAPGQVCMRPNGRPTYRAAARISHDERYKRARLSGYLQTNDAGREATDA